MTWEFYFPLAVLQANVGNRGVVDVGVSSGASNSSSSLVPLRDDESDWIATRSIPLFSAVTGANISDTSCAELTPCAGFDVFEAVR